MSREYGLVSTTLSDKTWTFARGLPPLASAVRDAAASRKESLIGLEQLSRVAARSELRAANLFQCVGWDLVVDRDRARLV